MRFFTDLVNAIRFLSIDAVERARSGHPGMPLGMAVIATVLWKKFLKFNPKNPQWFNRDRFILSNGHGVMLLYSLLHLTGYSLSLDELKRFRQLHSKTPGHPEYYTPAGVETTTGPLAEGLANAVGIAIAEKVLASQFNRNNIALVNHFTYVFVGDGCLMEGLSHEVCSLAGTLRLGKLIVFYDDNGISIDGKVDAWFTDETALRFAAYHWQVIGPIEGHDREAIEVAIEQAQKETGKPSLIICKTIIGYGSPLAGSEKCHGAPLGAEGVSKVRDFFNWSHPPFFIPDEIYAEWNHREQGEKEETNWLVICHKYQQNYPQDYILFLRRINGDLPDNWEKQTALFIEQCCIEQQKEATRKSSQRCIAQFSQLLPEMLGGSADLSHSNNTHCLTTKAITANDFSGNYLYYGVREFGMAGIMNGLALHGGFIPFGGTFLVFSDYARNALRQSALMSQRVIYVLSHDSIGLGEDGPTHQPIEHVAMLRMTPHFEVWRPASLVETAVAWQQTLERHNGPSALLLSRQELPPIPIPYQQSKYIKRGGYILKDCQGTPDAIILATGSELHLALEAAQQMLPFNKQIRVVSMPCCERFLKQEKSYQDEVLLPSIRQRVAVEASATNYWYRFVGLDGIVIGIDRFGISAPAEDAFNYLGITVERLVSALKRLLLE